MSEKQTARLENWTREPNWQGTEHTVYVGSVYDHPLWVDGAVVHTSAVVNEAEAEHGRVETLNTHYTLGEPYKPQHIPV